MKLRMILLLASIACPTTGCSGPSVPADMRRDELVPQGATLAASGTAPVSTYITGGQVFVVDADARALIFSGTIPSPMLLRVDPASKSIVASTGGPSNAASEDVVLVQPIDPAHRFNVYTLPEPVTVELGEVTTERSVRPATQPAGSVGH